MDAQFQELSERIARDVAAAVIPVITRDVTAAVSREVTAAVTRDVTATVTATVTANLTEVVSGAEQRLSSQAQIHTEAVKEQAKLAAEGYAATLDGINRRLDRIEKAVTVTLLDHHNALVNHSGRISTLEQKL